MAQHMDHPCPALLTGHCCICEARHRNNFGKNELPPEFASQILEKQTADAREALRREGSALLEAKRRAHEELAELRRHTGPSFLERYSPPPEQLSPAICELLTILAEECGETVQRCTKILRFGLTSPGRNNVATLESELGDIAALTRMLEHYGVVDRERIQDHAEAKLDAFAVNDGRLKFAKAIP